MKYRKLKKEYVKRNAFPITRLDWARKRKDMAIGMMIFELTHNALFHRSLKPVRYNNPNRACFCGVTKKWVKTERIRLRLEEKREKNNS